MTFNEFIDLNPRNTQGSELIFESYLTYLTDLSKQEYPIRDLVLFKSYCDIFLNAIYYKRIISNEVKENYKLIGDKLINNVKQRNKIANKWAILRLLFPKYNQKNLNQIISNSYEELLTKTIELLNMAKEFDSFDDHLELGAFYTPDNSNKAKICDLINEAIELLKQDTTLNEKCKKKIVDYLTKALNELISKHPNWTLFLGRLKESIIILGAIGSFAGGLSVIAAKDKIEKAAEVVQQTSITISFKSITQTFNIQNVPRLENFQNILKLEEHIPPDTSVE
jgi:hypothetical protein